jgi:hypothetical protein
MFERIAPGAKDAGLSGHPWLKQKSTLLFRQIQPGRTAPKRVSSFHLGLAGDGHHHAGILIRAHSAPEGRI